MKAVAFNGSPRKAGNTSFLIAKIFEQMENQGIETEEINVGIHPVRGCVACGKCWELQNRHCVITNDPLNSWLDKMIEADAVILGSPVYCADISGQIKSFMDRSSMVACANNRMLKRKLGAGITAVRRAGGLSAFHSLNSWFTISQMIVVGSSYWNMGYGLLPGEVEKDAEGMQTMANLGKNMAWLLKVMEIGKKEIPEPDTPADISTNFIR